MKSQLKKKYKENVLCFAKWILCICLPWRPGRVNLAGHREISYRTTNSQKSGLLPFNSTFHFRLYQQSRVMQPQVQPWALVLGLETSRRCFLYSRLLWYSGYRSRLCMLNRKISTLLVDVVSLEFLQFIGTPLRHLLLMLLLLQIN